MSKISSQIIFGLKPKRLSGWFRFNLFTRFQSLYPDGEINNVLSNLFPFHLQLSKCSTKFLTVPAFSRLSLSFFLCRGLTLLFSFAFTRLFFRSISFFGKGVTDMDINLLASSTHLSLSSSSSSLSLCV